MNKKGFTLVELLVTILLITIVSGLCVVSFSELSRHSNPLFYETIENNIQLAASDYVLDHRNNLPLADNLMEINLSDLEDEHYIEKVVDVNGNKCNGKIIVFRENEKYKYDVCIGCGTYKSSGANCK